MRAAGGGKTFALLLECLRHINNADYGAVIFRRSYPEITNEGGLWDESLKIYPYAGGIPKYSTLEWQFPSGASISFGYLGHDNDLQNYKGSQIALMGFDQLEDFSRRQFFYMLSRNRSTCGIKPYIRATANPDPDSFLAQLIDWWIDDRGYPIAERGGQIRYFVNDRDNIIWADAPETLSDRYPNLIPKSFTFIPASVYDNSTLMEADPGYLANLLALHPVDQERLLKGNWKVREEAGKLFNRTWVEIVDRVPQGGRIVRFYDLAATAADVSSGAFYTAGVKMKRVGSTYYVLDLVVDQLSPGEADGLIKSTAGQDGDSVPVRWELEGGSAGKRDEYHLRSLLQGFDAAGVKPLGDKVMRFKPFASEAYQGNIKLLRADWNDRYLSALHSFDGTKKPFVNDIADSSSGAYNELAKVQKTPAPPAASYTTW